MRSLLRGPEDGNKRGTRTLQVAALALDDALRRSLTPPDREIHLTGHRVAA